MKKFRGVFIKNEREIDNLRIANRFVSKILDELCANVKVGLPTMFFEDLTLKLCKDYNVRPAFLGMYGFPFALCCSVNEEIVHGFPSKTRILQEGDIVSFDVGVVYNGFFGDSARTCLVGQVSSEARMLSEVTKECLDIAIAKIATAKSLFDISRAVQEHAEGCGYHVIKRFVGHGIGSKLHEKPEIPNFVPKLVPDLPLKSGMVFAIEPMLAIGTDEVTILEDNWTAITKDHSLAAHWEHSVVIRQDRAEILSLSE